MTPEEKAQANRAVLAEWFEQVWNQGDLEAIDRLFAPHGIAHGLLDDAGNEVQGPEGFKPFVAKFKRAFPDLRIEIVQTVTEGDWIVARCIVRGTHAGDGFGMEATHRPFEITGMAMGRIENGQLAEGWNNFDFQSLFAQLQQ